MPISEHQAQVEQIGLEFVEAFNQRDMETLLALVHPDIEFHPTMLVGSRRVYKGLEGMRVWADDLLASGAEHQVRVRDVRVLARERVVVFSEVLLDGEMITPSAMIATLREGKIVEARAYLSEESTLAELGLLD